MPEAAPHLRIVLTTAGSREEAGRIAHGLVDERLAACVSLVPNLTSVYRWQGKVESAEEILLVIKTSVDCLESLEGALRRLHSYEVPELLVLGVESSGHDYLRWLTANLRTEF